MVKAKAGTCSKAKARMMKQKEEEDGVAIASLMKILINILGV